MAAGASGMAGIAAKVATGVSNMTKSGDKANGGGSVTMTEYHPSEITVPSYKKGGRVKKTGMAKVHRGERVLTKRQEKKYEKGKR